MIITSEYVYDNVELNGTRNILHATMKESEKKMVLILIEM